MKYLRKFNESSESEFDEIVSFIRETYPSADVITSGDGIEIDKCDVEPEHGSYCDKTYVSIKFNVGEYGDHKYKINISGISGQYGSDEYFSEEEDEEDFIEPEFDWTVGASKIKANATLVSLDLVKEFITDKLDEYLK